jgi:hypothetical protein
LSLACKISARPSKSRLWRHDPAAVSCTNF